MTIFEQVKELRDCQQIIGEYIPLKKKGRYFIGTCPFHPDKHPSMYVLKEFFKCHACGAGGDGIKFVKMHLKLNTMTEAANVIIKDFGLPCQTNDTCSEKAEQERKRRIRQRKLTEALKTWRNVAYGRFCALFRACRESLRTMSPGTVGYYASNRLLPELDYITDMLASEDMGKWVHIKDVYGYSWGVQDEAD